MKLIDQYLDCPDSARNTVIALGNFDGVHLGHQAIISKVIEIAQKTGKKSAVLSFEPHPLSVLKKIDQNFRLTLLNKKSELIKKIGVDYLFNINFNPDFALIEAEDFVGKILNESLAVSHIVIGRDFIFGNKRRGSSEMLRSMADECNYQLTQLDAVGSGAIIYSSSLVRKFLTEGKLDQASLILGRNFALQGKVVDGDKRGREIGFATANIDIGEQLFPKFGVYAVTSVIDNKKILGVANVGIRPTFGDNKPLFEVHFFDFDTDLYGKYLDIELIEFIREEQNFESVDQLKQTIVNDCTLAKNLLTKQELL